MAGGKRPVPFRTRKLSLSAPMVLLRRRSGRVGRRRTTTPRRALTVTVRALRAFLDQAVRPFSNARPPAVRWESPAGARPPRRPPPAFGQPPVDRGQGP